MKFLDDYQIKINNEELLLAGLTHSSYAHEHHDPNYERLEFLGDAIIQLIISEYLYLHTAFNEGDMSKKRAAFVCEHAFFQYATDLGIIPYIRVGKGQLKNINETIIADVFESTMAAIYLDQGINAVKKILNRVVIPYIKKNAVFLDDYKSMLQELVQTTKRSLTYNVIKETGPAHKKIFEVEVMVGDIRFGIGQGKSKKEAEQNAAFDAWQKQAHLGDKHVS